jgi:aminoglycoside phosphotransferase (APT) family kinase protein
MLIKEEMKMSAERENIALCNDAEQDVTKWMEDIRAGQVMMDLDAWVPKLQTFIEQQPEVRGKVVVLDIHRPATGTAGGNAMLTVECDCGDGRRPHNYVIRYEPPKASFHEYDMTTMFKVLAALQGTSVPAPKPLWLDAHGEFLGVQAFIMEALEGDVSKQDYFSAGPIAEAKAPERRAMVSNAINTIAKIHAVDWKAKGFDFLMNRGRGETFIERDISWYWSYLENVLPEYMKNYVPIKKWLLDNQPVVQDAVVNHGDCQLGNHMFRGLDVVGVLDWEMCCLLPREADIAYLCCFNKYLISLRNGKLPLGVPQEGGWLAEYEKLSGHKIQNWAYYSMLMLFRLAVLFCCGSYRQLTPEQWQATKPVWGWFEFAMMEKAKQLCG